MVRTYDHMCHVQRYGKVPKEFNITPTNLTMQINGIEIDPLHFIKKLEEQYQWQVERLATKLVDDLRDDALDPLTELLDDVTSAIKQTIKDKLKIDIKDTSMDGIVDSIQHNKCRDNTSE